MSEMTLSVSTWKYGKDWVYSITYDEALSDLARFVIPTHQALGVPGHVEVVAGQIGEVRNCGASSYNGMKHMSAEELHGLVAMGWGVGSHSWTHGIVMDNPKLELLESKEAIAEAVGVPVTVYVAPGSNDNLTPEVQEKIREYGYLVGMGITDDINRPDPQDLLWVNRVPLHERYWGVFDGYYDAYKRIRQAQEERGWIVDYCHCPLEEAVHPYKDCTEGHHRQRLEAVVSEGGTRCWYANPDEVVDYRALRRSARLAPVEGKPGAFRLRLDTLPPQVRRQELTFDLKTYRTPETVAVKVDGAAVGVSPGAAGTLHFTASVRDDTQITISTLTPGGSL
ncbi:MAG: polysaccharide deacetylase family protein [Armatimonadetes bacterium]|nr:polysaccharide deacetylase family protein [Armatimonadota bacterium]